MRQKVDKCIDNFPTISFRELTWNKINFYEPSKSRKHIPEVFFRESIRLTDKEQSFSSLAGLLGPGFWKRKRNTAK